MKTIDTFADNLRRWKETTDLVARESRLNGQCGVFMDVNGLLTKILTREPGNRSWSVNPKLLCGFQVHVSKGLIPVVRFCIAANIDDVLTHLVTDAVLPWTECNPVPPKPEQFSKNGNGNWYFISGPDPVVWKDSVARAIDKATIEVNNAVGQSVTVRVTDEGQV